MSSAGRPYQARAEYYAKSRPRYPMEVLRILKEESGLSPGWVIADIGSGTGLLAELLLQNGNAVYAVDPEAEMRKVAERRLGHLPAFRSAAGSAESTGLAAQSVDMIAVGQALHWFDPVRARAEFHRILKPDGWIASVWYHPAYTGSPFLAAQYEVLRRYTRPSVHPPGLKTEGESLALFLGEGRSPVHTIEQVSTLDLTGVQGAALSAADAPKPDDPDCAAMLAELADLFTRHQQDGRVEIPITFRVCVGRR